MKPRAASRALSGGRSSPNGRAASVNRSARRRQSSACRRATYESTVFFISGLSRSYSMGVLPRSAAFSTEQKLEALFGIRRLAAPFPPLLLGAPLEEESAPVLHPFEPERDEGDEILEELVHVRISATSAG